jgi:fructokinase
VGAGILVAGESLVDVVRTPDGRVREYAGGSAANVAIALARLGQRSLFATSFAEDTHGRMIAAHLTRDGVTLATDPVAVSRTSTALATIAEDGSATYSFDLDWRLNPVLLDELPLAVHACSFAAVLDPGAADITALLVALKGAATLSYDINIRASVTGTGPAVVGRVEALVALADVVKASDEDLEQLYPGRSLAESAEALRGLGPVAVVVTRGGSGASAFTPAGRVDVPTPPVEVADTIGAGDTFMAGLIAALAERDLLGGEHLAELAATDGETWRNVLAFAAQAAAINVSRPGADPPYRRELSPAR